MVAPTINTNAVNRSPGSNRFSKPGRRGRREGSALLITLAFVLLLTVVIIGFLFRALAERRLSASSATQVKADLLAEGAEAALIGDLQQEIIGNSTVYPTTGSITKTYYIPNTPQFMVPQYDGVTPSPLLANLIKVSNSNALYGFPKAPNPSLSTDTSANGRSVPLSRWANSCLIDPSATMPAPDWVTVARSGVTSNTNMQVLYEFRSNTHKTDPSLALGRFAYAIYDEGGLLDMNVAGRPNTSATLPVSLTSYPQGEALADLMQLNPTTGTNTISKAQIDTLIGWRNYASVTAQSGTVAATPSGSISNPAVLTAANATNYFTYLAGNQSGFLSTATATVIRSGNTYNTDQAFTSRQELIQFMSSLVGQASAPGLLQYMTHFSRALEQPSHLPAVNDPTLNTTGTIIVPTVAESATLTDTIGNTGFGLDTKINPFFLAVLASGTFTRNDGTTAVIGEPLVKKRFNLNRLAWITYKGPLWNGSAYTVPTAYTDLLKSTYGFTDAFLQQGTAGNIYNYFGLSWISDTRTTIGDGQSKWIYAHTSANAPATASASPITGLATNGAITQLGNITGREADFFELLKAGVTAGAIGKAATANYGASYSQVTVKNRYQNLMDTSIDYQIVQLGANIIDQFDLDGFPTRILFDNGSAVVQEFCGVENLPYLYGTRNLFIEGRAPSATPDTTTGSTTSSGTVADTGYATAVLAPVMWNPHDPNSPRCAIDPATGTFMTDGGSPASPLFPTSFRVVADSIDPNNIVYQAGTASGTYSNISTVYNSSAPLSVQSFTGTYVNTFGQPGYYQTSAWTDTTTTTFNKYTNALPFTTGTQMYSAPFFYYPGNSALNFSVNEFNTTGTVLQTQLNLFREPTILCTSACPTGSNLRPTGIDNPFTRPAFNPSYYKQPPFHNFINTNTVTSSSGTLNIGVLCSVAGDLNYYMGIYEDTVPLAFINKVGAVCITDNWDSNNSSTNATVITLRTQYEMPAGSGTWVSYDTKFTEPPQNRDVGWTTSTWTTTATGTVVATNTLPEISPFAQNSSTGNAIGVCSFDPRTSRFSSFGWYPPVGLYTGTTTTPAFGWTDLPNRVMISARPDLSSGFAGSFYPAGSASGTIGAPRVADWLLNNPSYETLPFGLFAQNDPNFTPNSVTASAQVPSGSKIPSGNTYSTGAYPTCYADPDGVVRRGMAAYAGNQSNKVGLPLAVAYTTGSVSSTSSTGSISTVLRNRPIVLNRPFKNAGELGYVFSGTPWRNIDFDTPESGYAGLLDLFTVGENSLSNGLVAGKVNLNTQQVPVLKAILAGAYQDEETINTTQTGSLTSATTAISPYYANLLATALATRTASTNATVGQGPVRNVSELVGRFVAPVPINGMKNATAANLNFMIDGSQSYAGFSGFPTGGVDLLTSVEAGSGTTASSAANAASANVARLREATIRALAAAGQARVWNLMIDIIAQTGRYPYVSTAGNTADNFIVEGEQRYWVHVAIDRYTGQVIDKQVEVVKQ